MIEINDKIKGLVEQIANLYRTSLAPSKASGKLQDFETEISISDKSFLVIFNLESYWKYVERGRGPGKQPPLSLIEEWIRIKPIVPNPINNKIPDTKQLAFLIARKIGRDGYKGRHYLQNTLESNQSKTLIDAIKQEIILQVKKYISNPENSR